MKLQIFMIKKFLKVGSNQTCLAVISLDSAPKKNGSCYPQVLLKVCKYIEKKIIRHIDKQAYLTDFSCDDKFDEEEIRISSFF